MSRSYQPEQDEKRAFPRVLIARHVPVTDLNQEPVGRLCNLSRDGFMLVGSQPLESGQRYQFAIMVPESQGDGRIHLQASCVWCQPSTHTDGYGAGFQIEAVAAADFERFESLLKGG